MKNCSVLWEDSGNAFFEGVGFRAVELAEALGFGIQVKQQACYPPSSRSAAPAVLALSNAVPCSQIEINPEPDLAMVEQSIRWAIGEGNSIAILISAINRVPFCAGIRACVQRMSGPERARVCLSGVGGLGEKLFRV